MSVPKDLYIDPHYANLIKLAPYNNIMRANVRDYVNRYMRGEEYEEVILSDQTLPRTLKFFKEYFGDNIVNIRLIKVPPGKESKITRDATKNKNYRRYYYPLVLTQTRSCGVWNVGSTKYFGETFRSHLLRKSAMIFNYTDSDAILFAFDLYCPVKHI